MTTFIEQHVGKNILTAKSGNKAEIISKLTHLYLHDKYIQSIGNLSGCANLQVLYLQNNEIQMINNLDSLPTLKHLYLQKNKIKQIEGLGRLKNLRKLYLGCNEISVIEGLDTLINLEELHVEKQVLNKGESLCFDPRSLMNLSETLQILNISHNNIASIDSLEPLKQLRHLNASFNNLSDMVNVANVVHNWYYLIELNFIGNPMTKQHRYMDTIISNTFRLVVLDNKDINETTRTFIKQFEHEKNQNRMNSGPRITVVPKNLAGSVPPVLRKEVSKAVIKNMSNTILSTSMNEIDTKNVYIPWQVLKPSFSDTGTVIPPLFAKHQRRKKSETKKVHFQTFPEMP